MSDERIDGDAQPAKVKYRYTGDGYLFNVDHRDISEAEWAAMPVTVREAVMAHPAIYQLVVDLGEAGVAE